MITTKDGVQYRKIQAYLKPYQPQIKKSEDEHLLQSYDVQTRMRAKSLILVTI